MYRVSLRRKSALRGATDLIPFLNVQLAQSELQAAGSFLRTLAWEPVQSRSAAAAPDRTGPPC